MSNPQNELAKYRSYSYYHVLAICDSSATAVALASSTDIDSWLHPDVPDSSSDGSATSVLYLPKQSSGAGKYCILINGSTDASLTITKATWTSFTAASATMDDRNTSIATEGQLSISEPRGITCLDTIVRICLSLGVDSANAFWVLKTFFVGYTYDTISESDGVDHITNIPPVIFLAYDVTGSFSAAGGEYEVSFVAAANGAARLPQYSKTASSTNIKANGTLAQTVKDFGAVITTNYYRYFGCVYNKVAALDKSLAKNLRPVKYEISVGSPYDDASYTVTDQIPNVKDIVHCDAPGNVYAPAGISIEDGLHRIVAMCSKIKSEADEGVNGRKYIHKISNWLTSKPSPDDETKLEFTVGYRIDRQLQPKSVVFEDFANRTATADNPNLITFDYTYTGKNIDILEMDLKMNMGLVYLQGMTIASPYKYPGGSVPNKAHAVDPQGLLRYDGANIPVFFGTHIKTASIRDTSDPQTTAAQAYSMSKHASLEVLESTFKITGNSQLLGAINSITNPHDVADGKTITTDLNTPNSALQNWTLTPSFAKINVKMPRNNDDIALFTGTQTATENTHDGTTSNDYAVDFWFTGYYYIFQIENTFDQGEFTQTLNAVGIPENNLFRTNKNKVQERDVTLDKNIDTCYEGRVGCASSQTSSNQGNVVLPEELPKLPDQPEGIPTLQELASKQMAIDHLPAAQSPSNVRGWDSIPDAHKRAFEQASAETGVPVQVLAQFASVESAWNPQASNGSHAGYFQMGSAAWQDAGGGANSTVQDRLDPYDNIKYGARYTAQNYKILTKAKGGVPPTVGELYLAHNQGAGGAKTLLKAINNGQGNQRATISDLDAKVAQNHIPGDTNQAIVDWANRFVNKSLINGVPVDNGSITSRNPQAEVTEAPTRKVPKNIQEVLAAANSCKDQEKLASSDKNTTCPKVPAHSSTDTTTLSTQKTPTGAIPDTNTQPQVIQSKEGGILANQVNSVITGTTTEPLSSTAATGSIGLISNDAESFILGNK